MAPSKVGSLMKRGMLLFWDIQWGSLMFENPHECLERGVSRPSGESPLVFHGFLRHLLLSCSGLGYRV